MNIKDKADDIHNSQELLEISTNPVVKALWEVGKSAFPSYYAPLLTLTESAMNSLLEKRRDNKLTIFLKTVLDGNENITMKQLEDIPTIDAFILTLSVVEKTISNDKIALYGKLFANTYIGQEDINFDEYEEWLNSLYELSNREISILLKLYKYEEEYSSDKGWENINKYWDLFIKEIEEIFNLSTEDIYSLLERMLRTGFYYNNMSTWGSLKRKYKIGHTTSYFKKFAQKVNGM